MRNDIHDRGGTRERTESHRVRHDWSGRRELTTSIVMAVAEASGEDPLSLPVLRDVIDPDGLNDLFVRAETAPSVDVRFDYAGYEVVVSADGRISVFER